MIIRRRCRRRCQQYYRLLDDDVLAAALGKLFNSWTVEFIELVQWSALCSLRLQPTFLRTSQPKPMPGRPPKTASVPSPDRSKDAHWLSAVRRTRAYGRCSRM